MRSFILPTILCAMALCVSQTASAQLINLKTAPVATGDQFMVTPSVNIGMGNLSIALDDTLADPFVNPAKTNRIDGIYAYMMPLFYHITHGNGAAKTLSVGGLTGGKQWFGGLGIAVQDMKPGNSNSNLLKDQSANNNYVWLLGGKKLDETTSLGAQFSWSGLEAMGGVNSLYPNQQVDQHGHQLDVRIGLDHKISQKANYEILVLFHRSDMTYDLGSQSTCIIEPWLCYATVDYYPNYYSTPTIAPNQNKDITNTWGLHVGYNQAVGAEGWKLGGIATMNYKTHPKIPNYELMNIPRDPGNSWAFDVGLGTSHISKDHVTFGTDLIIEPIWSTTWANVQQNISNPVGSVQMSKGYKTVKNRFSFLNSIIKTGLGWKGDRMLLQTGIQAKTYRYTLKQQNFVQHRDL